MKKSILFLLFCLFVTVVSGQSRKFYFMYTVGYEGYPMDSWIIVDLNKMEFEHSVKGDNDDEPNPKIVDYKKTSKGESFNTLYHGMKTPYVISPKREDGTYVISMGDLSNGGVQQVYTLDEKQQQAYIEAHKIKEDESNSKTTVKKGNPVDKAKDGAKNLLNKGKNVFKKKEK